MKKEHKASKVQSGRPVPVHTDYTHAGMRRDSVRPVVHTPLPNEESVTEEMHWVMENQK